MKQFLVAKVLHDVSQKSGTLNIGKTRFMCLPRHAQLNLERQYRFSDRKIDAHRAATTFLGKLTHSDFKSWLNTI